ncbi:NAD(P)-binding domain-containing protein [Alkalicoccus chagannorensis]|uniref:NAD(P)-binding domain-containing protein n=1 Tax=Alkalicoccus chagannorensis TaxID=427072 RepID=UPI000411CEBB|nr:NAD(P)-binding domain-containing protein [Alkalicoccus chagannorensis]
MNIGMVGTGIMGKPIALHLLKAGHQVTVFDLNQETVQYLENAGAHAAASPAETAVEADLVLTMLPDSHHVQDVLTADHGILSALQAGTIIADLSSILPEVSKSLAAAVHDRGGRWLDAPVSGGEPKAIDGTLSLMIGGDEDAFHQVQPVFDTFAASSVYLGPAGAGTTTKLANQIIVNGTMAAVGEAVHFAEQSGLDVEQMFTAIRGGLAGSTVLEAKLPMMAAKNYEPGGRIDINAKDLTNVKKAADQLGLDLPVSDQVLSMFQALMDHGRAGSDHAALHAYYTLQEKGEERP